LKNSLDLARKWTEFIAHRAEFGPGKRLLEQFEAGDVVNLCDCGCNSYQFKLRPGAKIQPLDTPGGYGCAFALEFATPDEGKTIGLMVFVDPSGNLAGIDVDYCGNTFPVPDAPQLIEPPFQATGRLANAA
jgi:hypothetical protein